MGVRESLMVGSILLSLVMGDEERLFTCLLGHGHISFDLMSVQLSCLCLNCLFGFLVVSLSGGLHIV